MRESSQTIITLFWDKNTPKTITESLRKLRISVNLIHYLDLYKLSSSYPESGDDPWLSDVGKSGYTVITQDYHFHTKQSELFAINQHKIGVFYLWGAVNTQWEIMQCFAKAYDDIIQTINTIPKPFIYRVEKQGSLKLVNFK